MESMEEGWMLRCQVYGKVIFARQRHDEHVGIAQPALMSGATSADVRRNKR
jgi:hypothetical protein